MSLQSNYDELVSIPFNAHKSSPYQITEMVDTSLFSGKNRTAVIKASLDATDRKPFQTIADTETSWS